MSSSTWPFSKSASQARPTRTFSPSCALWLPETAEDALAESLWALWALCCPHPASRAADIPRASARDRSLLGLFITCFIINTQLSF